MLDLEFSQEQDMLRQSVRSLLVDHCDPAVVRSMEDDPIGYPEHLWRRMADLDLLGLLLPEESGGAGMTMLEGVVLYEELGRALAPTPHFVSAFMSGGLLATAGSDTQRRDWLGPIVRGEKLMTVAWLEPGGGFTRRGVRMRAEADGDGFVLRGVKRHVAFARACDAMVVLAQTGADDVDLFIVSTDAPGVELTQRFTLASDTQYDVSFDDVGVQPSDRIGAAGSGWSTFEAVLTDGLILLGAQAVGGARRALDITVQYAKDRRQFDKPLGAFQAISHYLSDAVTAVDGAEELVHEAAWDRATGRSTAALAPMAKLFACRTFRDVTAMAQQVFGGIGFTLEFDIQLYFRRAKQLQLSWCDQRTLEELVASAVLEPSSL